MNNLRNAFPGVCGVALVATVFSGGSSGGGVLKASVAMFNQEFFLMVYVVAVVAAIAAIAVLYRRYDELKQLNDELEPRLAIALQQNGRGTVDDLETDAPQADASDLTSNDELRDNNQ
ncbi:expressed unknown protein [Seminavis robusta]|uniref:Uncharacterized protein n=1 Tax=Seminavis robusta TaxID=568900 RepID=A0A9N8H9J5_9STRA|nr:expressed unknown protein [Seminavis robusta]|eukprot:Sro208_g087090.1 n/a (118) ;mRNA; r:54656-55009